MAKTALITGVTGQDGSYLAEFLLDKQYQVVGMVSPDHDIGSANIEHIKDKLVLESGDLLNFESMEPIIRKYQPDEIYNLAGITYIPTSWQKPSLTLDVNLLGLSRLLEIIGQHRSETRFFQASSAKIFGATKDVPQTETTAIEPADPYGISKAAGHQLIKLYRQKENMFLCSGILYNHESIRRGSEFVTRKITQTAAKIKLNREKSLELGNLDAQQDWGYAPDYVRAMWLMLQQDKADDYVLATGKLHTVKDICQVAFTFLDLDYREYVKVNPEFVRPQTYISCGDAAKAKKVLNWQPSISFEEMIQEMVAHDLEQLSHTN